jgi:multiple sugar transport system permease protein
VSARGRGERVLALWLCAPAVGVMLLVTAYPIAYSFWLSLQRYDLRFPDERRFVGLANYADVLASPLWWKDLGNTLFLTVTSVAFELVLGMALAWVMYRAVFARGAVRATILIPYGIVTVVAGRGTSFAVILLAEIWKTTPFMALLLLAGLTLVPDELQRAARIDGAGPWQRFFRITLPIMKPTIAVAVLFRSVDAFRIFDSVYVMTRGSAGTETVSILGYYQLLGRLNLGIGAAVSVLVFLCVVAIAVATIRGFGATPAGRAELE